MLVPLIPALSERQADLGVQGQPTRATQRNTVLRTNTFHSVDDLMKCVNAQSNTVYS